MDFLKVINVEANDSSSAKPFRTSSSARRFQAALLCVLLICVECDSGQVIAIATPVDR